MENKNVSHKYETNSLQPNWNGPSYLLFLGDNSELNLKEVEIAASSILPFLWVSFMLTSELLLIKTKKSVEKIAKSPIITENMIDQLMVILFENLGGVKKMAKFFAQFGAFKNNNISQIISQYLIHRSDNHFHQKINFGLSNFSQEKIKIEKIAKEIKNQLKGAQINCRFILAKENDQLSTAQIWHNQLDQSENAEINLVEADQTIYLADTIACQNPDQWSNRDFGIPEADPYAGMLPPKLARIMINLGRFQPAVAQKPLVIYDPFCGHGRILLESAVLGLEFVGSDFDPLKVKAASKNLHWLGENEEIKDQESLAKKRVLIAEAQKISLDQLVTDIEIKDLGEKQLIVVSEPDLGPILRNKLTLDQAKEIADRLSSLYLKSIENLSQFSPLMVLVLPAWRLNNNEIYRLSAQIIDKSEKNSYYLEKLGEYSRPNSFIIREIWKIKNGA